MMLTRKNNNFWILDSTDLVKVDRRTGVEVKRISLSDIIKVTVTFQYLSLD